MTPPTDHRPGPPPPLPAPPRPRRAARPLVLVWLALLVLLFASLGSAYLPLGPLNLVAGLAIAALKIALIVRCFMHLNRSPAWSGMAALAALCALVLLAALTTFEGATRPADPAVWQQPQQLPPVASKATA
jgi:cytochrome c oxidase subunit 4